MRRLIEKIRFFIQQVHRILAFSTRGVIGGRKSFGRGYLYVRNLGTLSVGNSFRYNSGRNYNVIGGQTRLNLVVENGARLTIGDRVGISNTSIICKREIRIGDDVTIGGDCRIYDTDFHSIVFEERAQRQQDPGVLSAPVSIGNKVFIGASVIILKGVSIGDRSVIGAGSVVTKSVPENEIWAGNPAKFIRKLDS